MEAGSGEGNSSPGVIGNVNALCSATLEKDNRFDTGHMVLNGVLTIKNGRNRLYEYQARLLAGLNFGF